MTHDPTTALNRLDREERDALLSAYALGELTGAERDGVERLLADPAATEARRLVTETRTVATALREDRVNDMPPRSAEMRRAVIAALATTPRTSTPQPAARPVFSLLSRWLPIAGALAATLLVAVTLVQTAQYREVAHLAEDARQTEEQQTATPPAPAAAAVAVESAPRLDRASPPVVADAGKAASHPPAPASETSVVPKPAPAMGLAIGSPKKAQAEAGGLRADRVRRLAPPRGPIDRPEPSARESRDRYAQFDENRFLAVADRPLSTFSIDVDTASYAVVRRFLTAGRLPPPDAVRVEEFVNYFRYSYPRPGGDDPFAVALEAADCPWHAGHRLVRIGIAGREIDRRERPAGNLVFLIDVSGSMNQPDKLPLVKQALAMLVEELTENDRVAIVTYAGDAGLKLPPTSGDQKRTIRAAIDGLVSGGSTHGSAGIALAYEQAQEEFIPGGANRVILCTDGDLNVGITSDTALVELIKEKARGGTFLTVLGFGQGNLQDEKMEKLADNGNGVYAYVDGAREARKVLVEQLTGSTITIAKDVKIQVEFNPSQVVSYRLLGYENRRLADADFRDDTKDAGEIGAGHTVTALYEIVPAGGNGPATGAEPLKYQAEKPRAAEPAPRGLASRELLTVKLRFKQPEGTESVLREFPLADHGDSFEQASVDTRFAAAVAAFGMILRASESRGEATLPMVADIASDALGADEGGYRAEFLDLVRKAGALQTREPR
jgi:Ca-activated chloride channel family protein